MYMYYLCKYEKDIQQNNIINGSTTHPHCIAKKNK